MTSNTLFLTNAFGSSDYTKGTAIQFQLELYGNNPSVATDSGSFLVNTWSTLSSTQYLIDTTTFTNVYTPIPYILTAEVLTISSTVTYNSPSTYTF
jgi:hypothetical protein